MDPEHATFLASRRLAQKCVGHGGPNHPRQCGCETCTMFGKILGADAGFSRAVAFIHAFTLPEQVGLPKIRKMAESVLLDLADLPNSPLPAESDLEPQKS